MNIFIDRFSDKSDTTQALNTIAECLSELTYAVSRLTAKQNEEDDKDE